MASNGHQPDLTGQTMIVTGANNGIGKITTRELARMGAHLVMVCRSRERGEAARQEIIEQSGSDKIDLLIADLSSQADIRKVAAEINEQYDKIDVLVNNAGALFTRRLVSVDGIEMTFALNHLGYFHLTHLLLDKIKASAPARIVNVSSSAHIGASMHFDDLEFKRVYRPNAVYGQSKLANILFSNELARRLDGTGVTSNALHPGFVQTGFGKNNGSLIAGLLGVMQSLFGISEEEGARTSIYLAASPEVEGITGHYFDDKQRDVPPTPAGQSVEDAQRLWEISAQMTGIGEAV
ncbi:MAG: SDR family oxidoreductase [Chloroflexi bacterium]|nr:SDR family oxidoreductase [Chloroflexota bacterium]